MPIRRLSAALSLLASALVAGACGADAIPSEPAAPSLAKTAGSPTTTRFTVPISTTMPENTCGLTTNVHLVGELTVTIHVTQTGTGRNIAHVQSSARGTAEGDDGSRYRWSYNQAVRVTDFIGAPAPDNVPQIAYVTDHFRLSGLGGAPDVTAHILFGIQLDACVRERVRDADSG